MLATFGGDLLHNEITLNPEQGRDIEEMFGSLAALMAGMNAAKGWGFCHSPVLTWGKLGTQADDELKFILKRHYVPFRWEAYVQGMKMFGIVPYKFRFFETKKTKGAKKRGHWIPIIPMRGSGYIRQYFDVDEEVMVYKWYWFNRPGKEYDPDMRFKVWYPPDMQGNYTSPAAAALKTWKMLKIVHVSAERAIYQASHLPQFMVHTPPKGRPTDTMKEFAYGDDEELEIERDRYNRELEKGIMDQNALKAVIDEKRRLNTGRERRTNGMLHSESLDDRIQRESGNVLDRVVTLPDYWTPASSITPALLVDPLEYEKRVDQIVASIVDFPLNMIVDHSAQHAGNFDAQITFARDRMKEVQERMNEFLQDVILEAERDNLEEVYRDAVRVASSSSRRPLTDEQLAEIYSAVHDFTVEQRCTPLITYDQLYALYDSGIMDKQTLAEQAYHLAGIPDTLIKLTGIKRPAELATEQLEVEKKRIKAEEKLKQDTLVLQEKAMVMQAKEKKAAEKSGSGEKKKPKK